MNGSSSKSVLANGHPGLPEVDAAVRSVLAGLTEGVPRVQRRGIEEATTFGGRLLSMRHAEELARVASSVRIEVGTVVTPLARDHLKKAGVEVRWASRGEDERKQRVGEWGFSIDVERRTGLIEAVRRSFLEGGDAWLELSESLEGAVRWLGESESRGALLLTDEASTAVYLACRSRGVRATAAEDPSSVARAVRALGVNLLVVEPEGKSIALIKQMGAALRRAGGPVAPDWLRFPDREGVS